MLLTRWETLVQREVQSLLRYAQSAGQFRFAAQVDKYITLLSACRSRFPSLLSIRKYH